ncbi:hypothetical protein AB1Y20_021995 [Prymnesium parvum]|uniref:Secreted protein n=1 Tax=Prymnesium parvum TaxID=97485 RepID=A0AB34JEV5_PRYPA
MRALLLLASAGVCSSWCCRACKKCLCESYGKCPSAGLPSPTGPPPRPPLRKALARLLTEHTDRLHGVTNTSSLPEGVPQPGQPLHLQFMTRLGT